MGALEAVFVSFRLGDNDGVSVEARKWEWALHELGFTTRRVAGELADGLRPDDTWLPYLAIDPPQGAGAEPDALAASLAGSDLVVVENLCSLPLNVEAARSAKEVLDRHAGRVVFHHHDLPWERPQLADLTEFPPHRPNSLHVTINDMARAGRSRSATSRRSRFATRSICTPTREIGPGPERPSALRATTWSSCSQHARSRARRSRGASPSQSSSPRACPIA